MSPQVRPLVASRLPLLIDVIGEVCRADQPGRLLRTGTIGRHRQLLQAGTSFRFVGGEAEVFLANPFQRYFGLTEFGQQAKVGGRHHWVPPSATSDREPYTVIKYHIWSIGTKYETLPKLDICFLKRNGNAEFLASKQCYVKRISKIRCIPAFAYSAVCKAALNELPSRLVIHGPPVPGKDGVGL